METRFTPIEQIGKATASVNHSEGEFEHNSRGLSSEPLQKYIAEFKEELRAEISKISEIKW